MRSIASALLAATLLAGNARAQLQEGDSTLPFRGGAILWVLNTGPDTVWIDTLFVTRCTNVHPCGAVVLALPVPPGERRDLVRLKPRTSRDPFGYAWTYTWRIVVPLPEKEPEDSTGSKEP